MTEILIVEDEQAISDLIKLNLTGAGYKCTCAYDGKEAARDVFLTFRRGVYQRQHLHKIRCLIRL